VFVVLRNPRVFTGFILIYLTRWLKLFSVFVTNVEGGRRIESHPAGAQYKKHTSNASGGKTKVKGGIYDNMGEF
jgi:hypothetical protein